MECLNCTNELINLPKKRQKIFCNATCRTHYWQKAKKLEEAGKSVEEIVKTTRKSKEALNKSQETTKKEKAAIVSSKEEVTVNEAENAPNFKNEIEKMIWEQKQKILNNKKQ